MAKFHPRRTSKHANGHGKPKTRRAFPKLTPKQYALPKPINHKPYSEMSELEIRMRFLMKLEEMGYRVWED